MFAALGVVVQLKDALNTIWETKEPEHRGLWEYLLTYLVSFAGILGLGLLLAVSLVINTALTGVLFLGLARAKRFWALVNFIISLVVLSALFGMLFKWFPDADVSWRDAMMGGFMLRSSSSRPDRHLLVSGLQGLESSYAAAASLVVLLISIYYSAQILLFGAEVTHVLSANHPDAYVRPGN
jgi:membrane protein